MSIKKHEQYKNFYVVEHPLIAHKLTILRNATSSKKTFKELIEEITLLLAYEATQDLKLVEHTVTTPLETMQSHVLAGKKPVILPILRAGIGMIDSFLKLMPAARVAHIGMFRDEKTLLPHEYYFKIPPNSADRHYFVCDPMLATGGSAISTIDRLKKNGIKRITFVCIVAAPEGASRLYETHPDVDVFAASLDRQLNKEGYILPGLGDAGDRLFGIK